jgi:hypothetical protein
MAQQIPKRDDQGKFAGSYVIGDGKDNTPAPPLSVPKMATGLAPIAQAAPLYARSVNIQIPEFADPETTRSVLDRIDGVALGIANYADQLRDSESSIRSNPVLQLDPYERDRRIQELKQRGLNMRTAAHDAASHLEHARSIITGEPYREPEPVDNTVIQADRTASLASDLVEHFDDDAQDAWNRGDLTTLEKVRRASVEVLRAKRILSSALHEAKYPYRDSDEEDEEQAS